MTKSQNIFHRLKHLWLIAKKDQLENVEVHLGPEELSYLQTAHPFDEHVYVLRTRGEIFGCPVVVHAPPITNLVGGFVGEQLEHSKDEPVSFPVCLYVSGVKPNGRVVYFDDPETDPVFL